MSRRPRTHRTSTSGNDLAPVPPAIQVKGICPGCGLPHPVTPKGKFAPHTRVSPASADYPITESCPMSRKLVAEASIDAWVTWATTGAQNSVRYTAEEVRKIQGRLNVAVRRAEAATTELAALEAFAAQRAASRRVP